MGFSEKVMESGKTINALLVIGFLGIVWLIIYGNLSGNVGFGQIGSSFTNETITLQTAGDTPSSAAGRSRGTLSGITMGNATNITQQLNTGNYSVIGVTIYGNETSIHLSDEVNVSYTVTYDSEGLKNTEGVIGNLSKGVNVFFGFAPTWFIILAIVLLILILVGLLGIVMKIASAGKGKGTEGEGSSGFYRD